MSQGSWQREQMGGACKQQPQPGRNVACVNNCGFFGNETTLNMCPNCYRTYLSSCSDSVKAASSATVDQVVSGQETSSTVLAGSADTGSPSDMAMAVVAEGSFIQAQDSDSSLLARASLVDSSPTLGARARFPRVQSASEGASRESSSPASPPGIVAAAAATSASEDCSCEGGVCVNINCSRCKMEALPADTLVRTNASRALDVDMYPKPSLSLTPASFVAPPPAPRPVLALTVSPPKFSPAGNSKTNRCDMCRKKVGLTGFKCRCKGMFCGSHRYSDKHQCTFDYKSAGREAIAKANPVVVADKIIRF